jgi:hypothetical protein
VAPGRSTPTEMVTGLWLTVLAEVLGFAELVVPAVAVGELDAELQAVTVAMVNATITSPLNLLEGLAAMFLSYLGCRSNSLIV